MLAAFKGLGLHRIVATCQPENTASAAVLEKISMRREGHLRRHLWQRDHWRDSYLYAALEDETLGSASRRLTARWRIVCAVSTRRLCG